MYLTMATISAIYNCYNQYTSCYEVLNAFRKWYPSPSNAKIILVNDGNNAANTVYLNYAQYFNCDYYYEPINIGYPGGSTTHNQILQWIHRFLYYIQFIETEWFLLLEDDVFLFKEIDTSVLKYDVNGINEKNILPVPVHTILETYCEWDNIGNSLVYGAMGGAIFKTQFFKEMSNSPAKITKFVNLFGLYCPQTLTGQNWFYSDVVLSYLTFVFGGTLGNYDAFSELWHTDMEAKYEKNQISVLNQYKFLYGLNTDMQLLKSRNKNKEKYTIVLLTRGDGSAFTLFLNYAIPLYKKHLKHDDIYEFILIAPQKHLNELKTHPQIVSCQLPFVFYCDENFISTDENIDTWIMQQIIKLAVTEYIQTEHYFIVDDDMFLTKPLCYADFFDNKGQIYYSYETWPDNTSAYANNTQWLINSCALLGYNSNKLKHSKQIMGVTPQLLITRVVEQLLQTIGDKWKEKCITNGCTEFSLYWIYLAKTYRTHYYTPCNLFFAMDQDANILILGYEKNDIKMRVQKAFLEKKYYFLVIQSWLKYKKETLSFCIEEITK
jgi:hypothetical protein